MEAQQPEALRALAEAVKGWNSTNVWPHEEDEEIAILGQINEDGEQYPVAEINVDTYFREGESLALANFYAAANPVAVLGLLDRIAELERWQEDVRSNSPLLARMERAEQRVKELEAQQERKPLTEGEIAEAFLTHCGHIPPGHFVKNARAIERAHGIRE